MNLGEKVMKEFPKEWEKWDKWDYKIWSPLSFEDDATMKILLIDEDGTSQKLTLKLKG